jgi:glycosyltransferase involved in cell wall biosynthesis
MPVTADTFPFVSVIIPSYKDSVRLRKCLLSLQKQTYPDGKYEVIVVDNGSDDGTDVIGDEFEKVRILKESRRGSYRARNRGVCDAKGSVLAFTDADCIASAKWLEEGVGCLLSNPGLGIVGGKVVYFFRSPNNPNAYERYDSVKFMQQELCIEKGKFSVTANLFTFKSIFDKVGLFNASMKSGGDVEWGNRVYESGYGLAYRPAAIVFHPARYGFKQVWNKTVRVAQGFSQLEYAGLKPGVMIVRVVSRDLAPPLRKIIEIYRSRDYSTFRIKTELILLTLFFKYVTTWTKIHTYFLTHHN